MLMTVPEFFGCKDFEKRGFKNLVVVLEFKKTWQPAPEYKGNGGWIVATAFPVGTGMTLQTIEIPMP
jgi:hypothetical protein